MLWKFRSLFAVLPPTLCSRSDRSDHPDRSGRTRFGFVTFQARSRDLVAPRFCMSINRSPKNRQIGSQQRVM